MSQKRSLGVLCCLVIVMGGSTSFATTRYVDDSAPPGGNGLSWATAKNDLQSTLQTAAAGDEIRVGAGTYKPSPGTSRSTGNFPLHDGMILRGGYAGYGSPTPDDQNPAYTTVLSGDKLGNDGPSFTNRGDNAYHVVKILANTPPSTAACTIDSFTIVGGYADSPNNPDDHGGGLYALGPVVLTRCVFRDDYGYYAGAVFINNTSQVTDCTFEQNKAQYSGGAVQISSAALAHKYRRCTFRGNVATSGTGGAVDLYYAYPLFIGCTFVGNQASGFGGALKGSYYPLNCINCSFFGNSGSVGGAIWVEMAGVLTGCAFSGNSATSYAGAANGIEQMYNCTVANNHSSSSAGGIQGAYTMTVRNSIFWDNSDPTNGNGQSAQLLFFGTLQIDHSIVQGWTGSWGGTGNNGLNPRFVLPAGTDAVIGTSDDDLRLLPADLPAGSPGLDSGDNAGVPADTGDVDEDSNTSETLPLDIDGQPRIANDGSVLPDSNVVNRGAYENDHPAPHITAWRSIRVHASGSAQAQSLSIPLDATATGNGVSGPSTETRNGGIREIQVDYSSSVTLKSPPSISITVYPTSNGALGSPINMSGAAVLSMVDADTLRIVLPSGLPSPACVVIDVHNTVMDLSNNLISGDTDCQIRSLLGDETSSGDVTLTDAILEQARLSLPLSAFPGCDANLDGLLNGTDFQLVKSRVHSPAFQALCP